MRSDVQYAIRSFLKTPGFTVLVVLTLALGIGANTAIFTVINAVLLRPLPYSQPERLMRVLRGTSYPDMRDWIEQTKSFTSIGGFRPQTFDYTAGPEAERIDGALVTGRLLDVLGARALGGRLIGPADDRDGTERIVMISVEFWRSRLGSDPAAVGRRIQFSGMDYTIVGILEPGFELPAQRADVLAPFYPGNNREAESRGAHTLRAVARLRDGIARPQAQQEIDALALRLEEQYPGSNRGVHFRLQPLNDSMVSQVRQALWLLFATVGVVLLISCVNVANLLIARSAARRGEMAIRAALGAPRARLARQLLTESVLLAAVGGGLGLLVGHWTTQGIIGLAPEGVPRLDQAGLDGRVLIFTAIASLVTGALFGTLPAWSASSTSLADVARASGHTTSGGSRMRAALLVAEVALALVLVVGAGLLLRSFFTLTSQPVGFDTRNLATGNITFTARRHFDIPSRTRIYEAFEESVRAIPGVRGVALTTVLPIGGNPIFHNLAFEGRPMAEGTEPEVYYRGVSRDYFSVLGIPLRRGRTFTSSDRAAAPLVAVVNEAFVREYYPNEEPIGRRVRWVSGDGEWITIVGIVADVRGLSLDRAEVPAVHMAYQQERAGWRMWIDVAVRTDGNPALMLPLLKRELARLDATVPLTKAATMDQVLAKSIGDRRFNLYLLGGFALLSLLLAAAGTYGVMAYMVNLRMREMGVRLALGARPVDLLTLVVGRGCGLAALGVCVGLAGAWVLARAMDDFLFQVEPSDPATFVVSSGILMLAAATAAFIPARRAARVDPLSALRNE